MNNLKILVSAQNGDEPPKDICPDIYDKSFAL